MRSGAQLLGSAQIANRLTRTTSISQHRDAAEHTGLVQFFNRIVDLTAQTVIICVDNQSSLTHLPSPVGAVRELNLVAVTEEQIFVPRDERVQLRLLRRKSDQEDSLARVVPHPPPRIV